MLTNERLSFKAVYSAVAEMYRTFWYKKTPVFGYAYRKRVMFFRIAYACWL